MTKNKKIIIISSISVLLLVAVGLTLTLVFKPTDNSNGYDPVILDPVSSSTLKQTIDNDGQIWIYSDPDQAVNTTENEFADWLNNIVDGIIGKKGCTWLEDYTIAGDFSYPNPASEPTYEKITITPLTNSNFLKGDAFDLYVHVYNNVLLNTEDSYDNYKDYDLTDNNQFISCFESDNFIVNPDDNNTYLNFNFYAGSNFDDIDAYINSKFSINLIGYDFGDADINNVDYNLKDKNDEDIDIPDIPDPSGEYVTLSPTSSPDSKAIFGESFIDSKYDKLMIHVIWI